MKLMILFIALVAMVGCAPKTMYHWGSYESQIYTMYKAPQKAPPQKQVDALEEDIEKARAKNKSVAPGIYAHLGYQYFRLGKNREARKYFLMEKSKFPESSKFVDLMLKKIR